MIPIAVLASLSLLLSQIQVTLEEVRAEILSKEDELELTFKDLPYELQQVAICESEGRQFDSKGSTLRSKTGDLGIMQISEKYHGETAKKLNLDLHDPNDNMRYAMYLYEKNGLRDWKASSHCWKKKL